jgi:hypothetical protein
LATYVRDDEEEVPNMKGSCIGEEEVSLSQPVTVVVLLEEEDVPIPRGPTITVSPKEEEVLAPRRGPAI